MDKLVSAVHGSFINPTYPLPDLPITIIILKNYRLFDKIPATKANF